MLYRSKQIIKTSKVNLYASAMKERVQLYSTLYIACKSRQAELDEFSAMAIMTTLQHYLIMEIYEDQLQNQTY